MKCPSCNSPARGNFCAQCGSRLPASSENGDSFTGAIIEKPVEQIRDAWSFAKTSWLVLFSPKRFFGTYFSQSPPGSEPSLKAMKPFKFLALGLGLASIGAALEGEAVQRAMSQYGASTGTNQLSPSDMYERVFGRPPSLVIDTAHLTGVGFLDGLIHDALQLIHALFFVTIVVVLLKMFGMHARQLPLSHYYAYALGAWQGVMLVVAMTGFLAFQIFSTISPDAGIAASDFLYLLGYLFVIYLVVVAPTILFPNILPLRRAMVVAATAIAAGLWMSFNWFTTQASLAAGILINK